MIINYKFGQDDSFVCSACSYEIDFSKSDSFSYTFWSLKNWYPNWYETKALDLLYISFAVFAADRLYKREDAKDAWSRDYVLNVPVINFEDFQNNKDLLEKMLAFLTGDCWNFKFRKRELTEFEVNHRDRKKKQKDTIKTYKRVCMFSGGMDSYIGAIDLLEDNAEGNTLFVSHYGGGKGTKEYQDYLKNEFIKQFNLEERDFCLFYAKTVGGIEDTTRSRSFMFFAHAVVLASAQGMPIELIIPENGLISLNIPSTYSRIGTSSTRTTHPYYMKLFQQLLDNLGLKITFENPYQFKTKGEMLVECKNQDFMISNLDHTMSCSHPDIGRMFSETEPRHCGHCLPCVIRQAALLRAGIQDNSSYRDRSFLSGPNAAMIRNSYELGLKKFKPEQAFLTIQMNGPIDCNIEAFADLYIRGMQELKTYMESVV